MSRVSQAGENMTYADSAIAVRERLLDLLSGADRARVLDRVMPTEANFTDADPAAGLIQMLREVVSQDFADHGEKIDYAALRASPLYVEFQRCTGALRDFDPTDLPDRESRLAFWINLYNTLVLDAVISLGVQRSVMERGAGITFFRQAAYLVGGQRMSCDDIEHGILRLNRGHPYFPGRQFPRTDPRQDWVSVPSDARIHFALNCASRSCPPIRAYEPEKLELQLDLATRSFLGADVRIMPEENTILLSSIFKWFTVDFGGREGVIEFILAHISEGPERQWLSAAGTGVRIRYKPYDWNLNSKE